MLTSTMLYAAIAPQAALRATFGESLEGPVAEIVTRNWGALIALVGAMLIYGAFNPLHRSLICRHPWQRPERVTAVGRFGATTHYAGLYHALAASGVWLVHSPEQYRLVSELSQWYPFLQDLTPRRAVTAESRRLPCGKRSSPWSADVFPPRP